MEDGERKILEEEVARLKVTTSFREMNERLIFVHNYSVSFPRTESSIRKNKH